MANNQNIWRVQMQFTPVNTKNMALTKNKAEYILEEFENVLTELMGLCIEKKNYRSLQRLISIVRKTPWYSQQAIERVADLAESTYIGEGKVLCDAENIKLPKCQGVRIMRVYGAIAQAVGFMSKQWQEAMCLQDGTVKLMKLRDDQENMSSYMTELLLSMTDFGALYGESAYAKMFWDAQDMVKHAFDVAKEELNKLHPGINDPES